MEILIYYGPLQWEKEIKPVIVLQLNLLCTIVKFLQLIALWSLSAIDTTGLILWQKDLTPDGESKGEVSGAGFAAGANKIFVATAYGFLHAIDPESGEEIWAQALLGSGSTRPTYYEGMVYLVSNDESAWAIDAETGRVNWTLDNFF